MLTLFVMLVTVVGFVQGQQTFDGVADKSAVFRFYAGSNMFVFPGKNNAAFFRQVCDYMDAHRELIESGRMPIRVNGYCGTNGTPTERRRRVKTMSNRVKSELIHSKKAVEANFVTCNSTEPYSKEMPNAVVLSFTMPLDTSSVGQSKKGSEPIVKDETPQAVKQTQTSAQPESPPVAMQGVLPKETITLAIDSVCPANPNLFALRINLLHWLAATPNVGIEWRPTSVVGLVLDADYAPWRWNDKLNYYRLWNIQPQVRFYPFQSRRFYVGGEFHVGKLNWKLKTNGTQGNFIGGGLTLGYPISLNRSFNLDFNLGAGYTSYEFDKYKDVNGFLIPYEQGVQRNNWGITSAGVTLLWTI